MNLVDQTSVLLMAREGSQRFKNKNVAKFGVEPAKTTLLQWKIEQLLEVFSPERVILSSDSNDYLDLGSEYKISLHYREKHLAEFGSFAENLRTVAKQAQTDCVLYANGPCNPLIGPRRMREFLASIDNKNLQNGAFAVEELKGYLLYRNEWLNFEPGEKHLGSENLENPFRVVWALTCRSTKNVISQGSMFSACKPVLTVPTWTAVDIDYEEDLVIAEAFLGKYHEYEKKQP